MPVQSVWMMRISMVWLLLTVITGGLLLVHKGIEIHPAMWALLPLHFEMAMWGWIVQLAMGTAYWIFPRHLEGKIRGAEMPATCMVVLFNAGLMVVLMSSLHKFPIILPVSGRIMIAISILIFMMLMWGRVKSYRQLKSPV